ncbi:DUF2127 domain-containing protein [Paracoccus panacisoli]|uniref:DUF2127 domain-containing protein n=1 Tax=Paracoccus panacisoli TaxID=1510163 RepID=A0ABV6T5S3_9RHOB|nr:DUF2127 domain-containing protein [Paracoccus sanguinis]
MSSPIAAPTDAARALVRHLPHDDGLLHRLFELSLGAKAVFAAIEAMAGAALIFVPNAALHRGMIWLTHAELIEDPSDPLVRRILAAASHIDPGSQQFYALYLLTHGLVKLAVVTLLARGVAFAYPLALAVFGGFVVYQMHRWQISGSPAMLALSALDAVVIALTWREWRLAGAGKLRHRSGRA